MVAKAYQKVKQGGKASGIDGESWEAFAAKGVEKQLYVIWNRLSSGSYHPQAVRESEIPKKNGKKRKLGIPTLRDRIAQEVIKHHMEKNLDRRFHDHSYGYRPMKSSHDALEEVRRNTQMKAWVVDLDIKSFFDEIDHELMLQAVAWVQEEKWVKVYVKRWLEMKIERADGTQYDRGGKGTPQGGVISPLLANLFLHFALDMWLSKHYPEINFVRYADDIVLHCDSKEQAEALLKAVRERLQAVKLELNEEKTKIVYCHDYRRGEDHKHVQFGFLGFSFQPRPVHSRVVPGTTFTGFTAGISKDNQLKIRSSMREIINRHTTLLDLRALAEQLNPKLRGWINYYSWGGAKQLRSVLQYLDLRLIRWLKHKHKQGWRAATSNLITYRKAHPHLFYHWRTPYCITSYELTRAV
jgi:group II intron reverse transcriptase/maturase